ncbi:MAG TPA: hypothetical protein VFZ78_09125, partial [Flavisolibacter sp.]
RLKRRLPRKPGNKPIIRNQSIGRFLKNRLKRRSRKVQLPDYASRLPLESRQLPGRSGQIPKSALPRIGIPLNFIILDYHRPHIRIQSCQKHCEYSVLIILTNL